MAERTIQYEGILKLVDIEIPCYVLANGTRVLSGRAMQNAIKLVDTNDRETRKLSGIELSRFIDSNWFKSLIPIDKTVDDFKPIICYNGKAKVSGYEATVLADFCDVMLDGRNNNKLTSDRQKIVAAQCEILIRAFAKVGIIALVDEATGYQYSREQDELQKILQIYIAEELMSWQKRFPDTFYKELFRLNGWDYSVKGIKERPGVIGRWTNLLVYEQLPKGVLEELKKKTPRNETGKYTAKLHQSLTFDIGHAHLQSQLNSVVTLFQLSDNMKHMWSQFEKMNNRRYGQLELNFDSNGHTDEKSFK